MVSLLSQKIQNLLDDGFVFVRDAIVIPKGTRVQKKNLLPLVAINNTGIVVFVLFDDCRSERCEELRIGFRNVLNCLVEKMNISMNSFVLYGCSHSFEGSESAESQLSICSFNIYNERIFYYSFTDQFDSFATNLLDELSYRRPVFDDKTVFELALQLELTGGVNGDVKTDFKGNRYIKKRGRWFLASELDPDTVFGRAAFWGSFGAHKFLTGKKGLGFIYFCSCGLFGVGWFIDCLAIIAGLYKDNEGKYLLPVSDRRTCLLMMFVGSLITVTYILLYLFGTHLIGDVFSSFLDSFISSNGDAIETDVVNQF